MAAYKIWITVFAFFALCADPLAAATSTKLPPFVLRLDGRLSVVLRKVEPCCCCGLFWVWKVKYGKTMSHYVKLSGIESLPQLTRNNGFLQCVCQYVEHRQACQQMLDFRQPCWTHNSFCVKTFARMSFEKEQIYANKTKCEIKSMKKCL